MRRRLQELMPGLHAPPSAPLPHRHKAQQQVMYFRQGIRNYTRLMVKGTGYLKIDIGRFWRLLSRNQGLTWEMMNHERYNHEIRK